AAARGAGAVPLERAVHQDDSAPPDTSSAIRGQVALHATTVAHGQFAGAEIDAAAVAGRNIAANRAAGQCDVAILGVDAPALCGGVVAHRAAGKHDVRGQRLDGAA